MLTVFGIARDWPVPALSVPPVALVGKDEGGLNVRI